MFLETAINIHDSHQEKRDMFNFGNFLGNKTSLITASTEISLTHALMKLNNLFSSG